MRGLAWLLVCGFLFVGNLSCSVNVLEEFSDKSTDEAKYYNSLKLMNERDYQGAIDVIATMTDAYESTRRVVALKASAYAGLCGFEFLPFVSALGGLGSSRLFPLLLNHFRGGTTVAKIDACVAAEDLVESIGSITVRTNDENLLLLMISFAKMGVILSYYADTNQDGTVTGGYDVCAVGGARTAGGAIPDVDARQFGTGLTLAMANIQAVSTSIDLGDSSLTAISDACADLAAIPPGGTYDFCSITDPTAFTAQHLEAIRSLLKEDQVVGLDSMGCNGDVSTCECIP